MRERNARRELMLWSKQQLLPYCGQSSAFPVTMPSVTTGNRSNDGLNECVKEMQSNNAQIIQQANKQI